MTIQTKIRFSNRQSVKNLLTIFAQPWLREFTNCAYYRPGANIKFSKFRNLKVSTTLYENYSQILDFIVNLSGETLTRKNTQKQPKNEKQPDNFKIPCWHNT